MAWFFAATTLQTVLAATLCFIPLFNVLGYEFSFAVGILAAITSYIIGLATTRVHTHVAPCLAAALTGAVVHLVPGLLLISLNALRVRNCSFAEGIMFYLLLPGASSLYGATLGVTAGRILGGRSARNGIETAALSLFLLLVPLLTTLWGLFAEPAIFAFDHLWGWFSGSLYDEGISVTSTLWKFRAGTLVRMASVVGLLATWERGGRRRAQASTYGAWSSTPMWSRTRTFTMAILLLLVFFGWDGLMGPSAGYASSRAVIQKALPVVVERPGITIHLPKGTTPQMQNSIGDDHVFRLAQLTEYMMVPTGETIHSYVYADANQKAHLMGGRNTMVAKPWLHELHIHSPAKFHPVLAHELVHVLAAEFGSWPLRVSARAGILVNLVLVEGLAEALTTRRGALDLHHATRAMRQIGNAPDLSRMLTGPRFWTQAPRRAYTAAGSFVRFLIDKRGIERFKSVYAEGNFERAYGTELGVLMGEWETFLDQLQVLPRDERKAREHFRVPSIFERPCAHVIAALRREARKADGDTAVQIHEKICAHLGETSTAKSELARALRKAGRVKEFLEMSEPLVADRSLTAVQRSHLTSLRGATLWHEGDLQGARAAFEEVQEDAISIASERLQWVRIWALDTAAPLRVVLRDFLSKQIAPMAAVLTFAKYADLDPENRTLPYLIGRQLMHKNSWQDALGWLGRASGHPFPLIEAERLRLIGECEMKLGDLSRAHNAFSSYRDSAPTSGEHSRTVDLLERIAWLRGLAVDDDDEVEADGPEPVD